MQKIQGISNCYPELIEGTSKWYYCKESKISFCDLYEAEEMVKSGHDFECMNCHLIQIYKYTPENKKIEIGKTESLIFLMKMTYIFLSGMKTQNIVKM